MDIARDEIRRNLRDGQREHDEALADYGRALDETFDPDGPAGTGERARLVGLPDRRGFLRIGGLAVASSALLVACVEDEPNQVSVQGTLPATTTTTRPVYEGSEELDGTLLLTAVSIEWLAIDTYQAAIDNDWLDDQLVVDVAEYFQGQHRDHATALATTARGLGLSPTEDANAYLQTNVVDPAVAEIDAVSGDPAERQTLAVTLAQALEDTAAQTYAQAASLLTTAQLRQSVMTIGATEARHTTVLNEVLGKTPVPFALLPDFAAAPEESYVTG